MKMYWLRSEMMAPGLYEAFRAAAFDGSGDPRWWLRTISEKHYS